MASLRATWTKYLILGQCLQLINSQADMHRVSKSSQENYTRACKIEEGTSSKYMEGSGKRNLQLKHEIIQNGPVCGKEKDTGGETSRAKITLAENKLGLENALGSKGRHANWQSSPPRRISCRPPQPGSAPPSAGSPGPPSSPRPRGICSPAPSSYCKDIRLKFSWQVGKRRKDDWAHHSDTVGRRPAPKVHNPQMICTSAAPSADGKPDGKHGTHNDHRGLPGAWLCTWGRHPGGKLYHALFSHHCSSLAYTPSLQLMNVHKAACAGHTGFVLRSLWWLATMDDQRRVTLCFHSWMWVLEAGMPCNEGPAACQRELDQELGNNWKTEVWESARLRQTESQGAPVGKRRKS